MKEETPLLKMVNISKSFGEVKALSNVDFEVRHREIVGLVGDNGAGKSTLMKILMGVYPPDKGGEIYFKGKKVRFSSPSEARLFGIEPVYQDLALVNLMSLSRNFFLGRELLKRMGLFRFLDKKKMDDESTEALGDLGISVRDSKEMVAVLSGGERQSIAIGRALYFGVQLLVMDEPVAALSVKESAEVFNSLKKARENGISSIVIAHNIYQIYPVVDRFTILAHGKELGNFHKTQITADQVIKLITEGHV